MSKNYNRNKIQYLLITAARNEEDYIEKTISSVIHQTKKPIRWVIVSDASTDRTDDIIQYYAQKYEFIYYSRRVDDLEKRGFIRKARAILMGLECSKDIKTDLIGISDADISFENNYFEKLIEEFEKDKNLGIAGGTLYEQEKDVYNKIQPLGSDWYVNGALQLFRNKCFIDVGGFAESPYGGADTIAVVKARMLGWKTRSFKTLKIFHHKIGVHARGRIKENFRQGIMFYALGSHPLFELLKGLLYMATKPYIVNGAVRLTGYIWGACNNIERLVDNDFVKFYRKEQIDRLRKCLSIKLGS